MCVHILEHYDYRGGGGGVERDQISDIWPPKKIKYQILDPQKISDIWPLSCIF